MNISWDDQIHYWRTVGLTNFLNGFDFQVDYDLYAFQGYECFDYKKEDMETYARQWNDSFNTSNILELSVNDDRFGLSSVAYIPYAAGIITGRALNLPFTWDFNLGKIFNLFFYALVIRRALMKLKAGSVIAATVGLFPTCIFMAASYSYDPWIICLTIYGFSIFLQFLQNPEMKMSQRALFLMLGAYILGCLPKAIYFILMLPLFFMPKSSFKSKKQHHKYIIAVFFSGLITAFTFVLPFVITGPGQGDTRGGSGVNATLQVQYILENPGVFCRMMARFAIDYFSPLRASCYIENFAYIDAVGAFSLSSVFVTGFAAVLDKDGGKNKGTLIAVSTIAATLIAGFLAGIAMYITFTPVGANQIAGYQDRYLLPGVLPALYMAAPEKIVNPIKRELFVAIPLIFMSATFLYNVMGPLIVGY